MRKLYFLMMTAMFTAQAAVASTVTFAISEGQTFESGQAIEVKDDGGSTVATLVFGEAGGEAFKEATADSHVEGFTAYTPGNGVNGNKDGGTFYTITPTTEGTIDVAVVLNGGKKFYILEDGTALDGFDGMEVDDKYYGTYTFAVKGGSSYKIYCAGSKLGFYGFRYTFGGGDTPASGPATFEEMTLDAESSYNGAGVEGETVTDTWGSQVTKSHFTSGGFRFTTLFNPQYFSWSGFAVSNETSTAYANYADQYRNCVGSGYKGSKNFAVVFPSGMNEAAEPVGGPATVSGMYVTNSAWNVSAYLEGDGMTPGAFTTGDWCLLTITGTHADETTATVQVYLADYRSANEADHYYINQWQWVDLTALGEVKALTFAITSSRFNDWGMTTPGYFCMDNLGGEPDESAGITHAFHSTSSAACYSLDGKRLSQPQRGLNIVRTSDGKVVKRMVK